MDRKGDKRLRIMYANYVLFAITVSSKEFPQEKLTFIKVLYANIH